MGHATNLNRQELEDRKENIFNEPIFFLWVITVHNTKYPSTPFILDPDLIELASASFTRHSNLTRYSSAFRGLTPRFLP
jgi:hypothetical protein